MWELSMCGGAMWKRSIREDPCKNCVCRQRQTQKCDGGLRSFPKKTVPELTFAVFWAFMYVYIKYTYTFEWRHRLVRLIGSMTLNLVGCLSEYIGLKGGSGIIFPWNVFRRHFLRILSHKALKSIRRCQIYDNFGDFTCPTPPGHRATTPSVRRLRSTVRCIHSIETKWRHSKWRTCR